MSQIVILADTLIRHNISFRIAEADVKCKNQTKEFRRTKNCSDSNKECKYERLREHGTATGKKSLHTIRLSHKLLPNIANHSYLVVRFSPCAIFIQCSLSKFWRTVSIFWIFVRHAEPLSMLIRYTLAATARYPCIVQLHKAINYMKWKFSRCFFPLRYDSHWLLFIPPLKPSAEKKMSRRAQFCEKWNTNSQVLHECVCVCVLVFVWTKFFAFIEWCAIAAFMDASKQILNLASSQKQMSIFFFSWLFVCS